MLIFFDCEFTGLRQNTELISIGLISEDNKTFYAEFNDFSYEYVDEWIKSNVIDNLKFNEFHSIKKAEEPYESNEYFVKGNKREITSSLMSWLSQFDEIYRDNLGILVLGAVL